MVTKIVRSMTGALWLVLVLAATGCTGAATTQYENYEKANRSGAIDRGWLPDFLPASATNIIESHNVEIDSMRAEFTFASSDSKFLSLFNEASGADRDKVIDAALLGGWSSLRKSTEMRAYVRANNSENGYLVLDARQNRAQYWEDKP